MKKRLRRKLHHREFAELGRRLIITRNRKDAAADFLDAFIGIIEKNGCLCGGGGDEDVLDVIVELGGHSDDRDGRLKNITTWLAAHPDVHSWTVGDEIDLWNGKVR